MFETKESLKKQMDDFLEGVIGCCEVTNYEKHMLWIEYSQEALASGCVAAGPLDCKRYKWDSNHAGLYEIVGYLGDRPVCMSLWVNTLDGHKILFYEPTSRVVDYIMIEEWLEAYLPATARRKDGFINRSDAMNFCNILPR
jgi:hypothetical protein